MIPAGPILIEWRLTEGRILTSVLFRPAGAPELTAAKEKRICRPWIPVGADAWRRTSETRWKSLSTLPKEWHLSSPPSGQSYCEDEE